jgi:N6-L-threonylcarbamoyladenine synthase
MYCIGIETSCDETSIAILKPDYSRVDFLDFVNKTQVLSSIISTQIETHQNYGGVVPEIGARLHTEQIHFVLEQAISEAIFKLKIDRQELLEQISDIFVTSSPGLISTLKVGIETAKSLSFYLPNNPKVHFINHLHGHIASSFLQNKSLNSDIFPQIHLLVSGGNSQIIRVESWNNWQIVGQTLDDAAGECFDKIGRMLGLKYPSGPKISQIAGLKQENPTKLPVSMLKSGDLNLSFSGLKTSVKYLCQKNNLSEKPLTAEELEKLKIGENLEPKLAFVQNTIISAQQVITEQLVKKIKKAIKKYNPKSLGMSGGVSACGLLRYKISNLGLPVFLAPIEYTGDNAVMIAMAGILSQRRL